MVNSKNIKFSTKNKKNFNVIEEIRCRINEGIQKIEISKLSDNNTNRSIIKRLEKENIRLKQILKELRIN